MKMFFKIALVLFAFSFAEAQTKTIESGTGYIQYKLRHPFHSVIGTSNDVKFIVEIDQRTGKILRAEGSARVESFSSGNSNRDSHAMEVIEALKYPMVSFKSTEVENDDENIKVKGLLNFHGVTNEILMNGKISRKDNSLVVYGEFKVSLTAHKVKRPTLLFIPVDDTLNISLRAEFKLD